MKLFDKLISKSPKPNDERLAELAEAKLRLTKERAAIEGQLAGREERRAKMLAEDRPEKEIVALEAEFDALSVKLEKLYAQERFIAAEALKATESQTLERWLVVNDQRLEAARQYAADLAKAQVSYIEFSKARQEALAPRFPSCLQFFRLCADPANSAAIGAFQKTD